MRPFAAHLVLAAPRPPAPPIKHRLFSTQNELPFQHNSPLCNDTLHPCVWGTTCSELWWYLSPVVLQEKRGKEDAVLKVVIEVPLSPLPCRPLSPLIDTASFPLKNEFFFRHKRFDRRHTSICTNLSPPRKKFQAVCFPKKGCSS